MNLLASSRLNFHGRLIALLRKHGLQLVTVGIAILPTPCHTQTLNSPTESIQPAILNDGLAYTKEESERRLDPQIKELLDRLLRIYHEPGLFIDKNLMYEVLELNNPERFIYSQRDNIVAYMEKFQPQGIFSRPGWRGSYTYNGRFNRIKGESWQASFEIVIDTKLECIDSRAVEGYLGLTLRPKSILGRTGVWDFVPFNLRHVKSLRVHTDEVSPKLPKLYLDFIYGCLSIIEISKYFLLTEASDAKTQHQ